jgi:hypothetical protein
MLPVHWKFFIDMNVYGCQSASASKKNLGLIDVSVACAQG